MRQGLQINVRSTFPQLQAAIEKGANQVPFATAMAINAVGELGRVAVRSEMKSVFDRPTDWVLNSLRLERASKARLSATVWFKEAGSAGAGDSTVAPHIFGGARRFKPMEARLRGIGLLPDGWLAVPGEAAVLDAFGNMSRGQISQLLNVLGSYTEAGFNKANINTVKRLAKGNAKKGVYGFVYWVNPVGQGRNPRLQPGVYQRVKTGFGSSLKPVLIFVNRARYKPRLPFFELIEGQVDRHFPREFTAAFDEAMRTAFLRDQGSLL